MSLAQGLEIALDHQLPKHWWQCESSRISLHDPALENARRICIVAERIDRYDEKRSQTSKLHGKHDGYRQRQHFIRDSR